MLVTPVSRTLHNGLASVLSVLGNGKERGLALCCETAKPIVLVFEDFHTLAMAANDDIYNIIRYFEVNVCG